MAKDRDFIMKGDLLFRYRGKDCEVIIPDYVRRIRKGAFRDNDRVTSVVIPASVKVIPFEAFCNCANLERVSLPKGIRIENGAFAWCFKLSLIENLDKASYIGPHAVMGTAIESVIFPEGQDVVENSTFLKCVHLKNVTLKENVKRIGKNVFDDVDSLETLHIPASVTKIENEYGLGREITAIRTPKGSYAEQYAKKHHTRVELTVNGEVVEEWEPPKPQFSFTPTDDTPW